MRRSFIAASVCLMVAACGSDSTPSADGPAAGAAPVITEVAWTHASPGVGCTAQNVTITVTATDSDTPSGSLTYSGSATGCTGSINAATSTLACPEASNYPGSAQVRDPENHVDTMSFTITRCTNGQTP